MTFKMASYFILIVIDLNTIFSAILIDNYVKSNKIACIVLYLFWICHNVCQFLVINYVCETVSTKANATADLLNRLSYSIFDIKVREIFSQFSLRTTYAPLRFYGIGFFEFGFKFLHRFIMSVATVLVIVIQAQTSK
ncbi:PREDICTED: gustatory and pheromone receptor 32a-like [Wasmannia auropunctata]|uniref:gustatory and pheromone receptor 32a-like n=1 Tax=Wasmannia auropunctata TaxID=64793 RepID=UPI0005EF9F35|nr:PREDICTED: gustatory and pheromone receptor 32a-like [Wasmannia auropunctata]